MPAFMKEPNKRHKDIAEIANHLGAKVSARDVKIICEAIRIEHEERYGLDSHTKSLVTLCRDIEEVSHA